MYFEETDLCIRVKQSGLQIVYIPDCSIIHYGGESAKLAVGEQYLDNKIFRWYFKSKYYFFSKNYGLLPMLAMRALDFSYGLGLLARNMIRSEARERSLGFLKGRTFCAVSLSGPFHCYMGRALYHQKGGRQL
jgi:GT2 family glycosyltransferase